jgi:thioredoxin-related protein
MKYALLLLLCGFVLAADAQPDTTKAPYLRFPEFPPVTLLLGDSTATFTKEALVAKKPVLLMLFSPDCSHCQHTAKELVQYKDSLEGIQVVMATLAPLFKMNAFVKEYGLEVVPGLTTGKDIYYFMPSFYAIHNLPFMAFYNRKGRLISVFEGSKSIPQVLEIFRKQK